MQHPCTHVLVLLLALLNDRQVCKLIEQHFIAQCLRPVLAWFFRHVSCKCHSHRSNMLPIVHGSERLRPNRRTTKRYFGC